MKTGRWILLMLVACHLSPIFVFAEPIPERIKIGLSIPLTGSGSILGTTTREGFQLYLKTHPEFAERVEIIVEDTTVADVKQGISATKKLLEVDRVDALIQEISPVANAMAESIDRLRVPTIAITGGDCARGRSYMVKLWLPLKNEVAAVSDVLKTRKFGRIGIITSQQDSMVARSRLLRDAVLASLIVADETVIDQDDSRGLALRLLRHKPDVVVLNMMNGFVGPMARRLREAGYRGDIISTTVIDDPAEVALASGALAGAYYPMPTLSPDFVATFTQQFGHAPVVANANGYDTAKLLHEGLESIKWRRDSGALNQALRRRNFTGAMGTYSFSFDEWNVYDMPASIRRVP